MGGCGVGPPCATSVTLKPLYKIMSINFQNTHFARARLGTGGEQKWVPMRGAWDAGVALGRGTLQGHLGTDRPAADGACQAPAAAAGVCAARAPGAPAPQRSGPQGERPLWPPHVQAPPGRRPLPLGPLCGQVHLGPPGGCTILPAHLAPGRQPLGSVALDLPASRSFKNIRDERSFPE